MLNKILSWESWFMKPNNFMVPYPKQNMGISTVQ